MAFCRLIGSPTQTFVISTEAQRSGEIPAFLLCFSNSNCDNAAMPGNGYVYILASSFKHLYIGVTSEIENRIWQHKNAIFPDSFTSRYRIDQLVYLETYGQMTAAIAREKQLKRWSRIKKIRLIVAENPTWRDLSEDWGKPMRLYSDPSPPQE
ncbi:Predicted endonuclease, GIY-YIG superfamily [Granulicella rosea]|uniref:Predicted endonuclease, GIY-YIG superfamily n=1 Tax=Granulicella rosea TaxID=474952 RepID=A0A239KM75_9BACT|nr:GIY-YIG nuclease family protein [Granulicella rosea]SNT18689.1 Predicted endonuclease, GIY-YIG superfamily [Granulicella rosea]